MTDIFWWRQCLWCHPPDVDICSDLEGILCSELYYVFYIQDQQWMCMFYCDKQSHGRQEPCPRYSFLWTWCFRDKRVTIDTSSSADYEFLIWRAGLISYREWNHHSLWIAACFFLSLMAGKSWALLKQDFKY